MSDSQNDIDRRNFLLSSALAGIAMGTGAIAVASPAQGQAAEGPVVIGVEDLGLVTSRRVSYPNISARTIIAANIFLPPAFNDTSRYPAIVVGHPFGGVKEQTAGLHALKLAQMGFVTIAYDASHYADSTGEPRYAEIPETRVSDYSSGIDYLSNLGYVDPDRLGILGICGGGCYAVSAAQIDLRIKAVATISMYDMGRARREGIGNSISYEQRMETLREVGLQRSREARGEPRRDIYAVPQSLAENAPPMLKEFFDYYRTVRGAHPNSTAGYSFTSLAAMMNFFPFAQAETISPRPVLFIVGERAESAYFSEDAHSRAVDPRELFVIPGATHVDLYDRPQYVDQSLAKLKTYFDQHLA